MFPQFQARTFPLLRGSILICIFLTACLPVTADQPAAPTCVSSTAEANPYSSHPQDQVSEVFKQYYTSPDSARQDALSWLAYHTKHWSAYRDIAVDETQMIRITITYIDPELAQNVVLNQVLYYSNISGIAITPDDFDNALNKTLERLGDRNEMLFFVTITAPTYDPQAYGNRLLTVNIPFKEMNLINTSDVMVRPSHDDHVLNEPILITRGPVSGFIGYPLSVMVGNECIWIMDSKWTTSLTLDIPWVSLGQTMLTPQSWSISYEPLVHNSLSIDFLHFSPAPGFPRVTDMSRTSARSLPPLPERSAPSDPEDVVWQTYWEDMGRFIWYSIVLDTHP